MTIRFAALRQSLFSIAAAVAVAVVMVSAAVPVVRPSYGPSEVISPPTLGSQVIDSEPASSSVSCRPIPTL